MYIYTCYAHIHVDVCLCFILRSGSGHGEPQLRAVLKATPLAQLQCLRVRANDHEYLPETVERPSDLHGFLLQKDEIEHASVGVGEDDRLGGYETACGIVGEPGGSASVHLGWTGREDERREGVLKDRGTG
jgi:hypothetical protein